MYENQIITQLENNTATFRDLFQHESDAMYLWKVSAEKWCLLEILCHMYDEEIEDFRVRVKCTMDTPELPPPPIDPVGWVKQRKYIKRDYDQMLEQFLMERTKSIVWLRGLVDPKWENTHQHPTLGPRSARFYLANWLAHDYLHIRQVMKLKLEYWQKTTGEDLSYAGAW